MKIIEMKNVKIGQDLPKICVPLVATNEKALLEQAEKAERLPCDLVEWRADYLLSAKESREKFVYKDIEYMIGLSEELRKATRKPILFTLRTVAEGGEAKLDRREYYTLIREFSEELDVDAIDIEAFDEEQGFNAEKIEFLVGLAHSNNKAVVLSNHDFTDTPDIEVMVKRLWVMQELGADIPKIAVMPKEETDVLNLLEAARIMKENYCKRPFIALSMGKMGVTTRVCGGSFGSAITFAGGGEGMSASAPGQLDVKELKEYICEYYRDTV